MAGMLERRSKGKVNSTSAWEWECYQLQDLENTNAGNIHIPKLAPFCCDYCRPTFEEIMKKLANRIPHKKMTSPPLPSIYPTMYNYN